MRLTADGGLAVHHDPVIGGVGAVHELTTRDLPPHVPVLADALQACAGMVVNIEVKNLPTEPAFDPADRCAADVVDLVRAMGARESVIVSSFWPGALAAVRASGSGVRTGLLVIPTSDPATAVDRAVEFGCGAIHLPVGMVSTATVAAAHDAGLEVAAWTVVDLATLTSVLAAGVDTVVTDDVAMARDWLDQA